MFDIFILIIDLLNMLIKVAQKELLWNIMIDLSSKIHFWLIFSYLRTWFQLKKSVFSCTKMFDIFLLITDLLNMLIKVVKNELLWNIMIDLSSRIHFWFIFSNVRTWFQLKKSVFSCTKMFDIFLLIINLLNILIKVAQHELLLLI